MRVLSCNCHFPFDCCSESSVRCYPPCTPKSEWGDAQNVFSSPAPVSMALEERPSDEKVVIEQNSADDVKVEIFLKSCLKKPRVSDSGQVGKLNVKWTDLLGKELVEIKEFEAAESEESEDFTDDSIGCLCVVQ
ncbi:unnamed protein product [Musa textilis]